MAVPEATKRGLTFLRLAWTQGWRPAWRAAGSVAGLCAVGAISLVQHLSVAWFLAALLSTLLLDGFFAWDEADRRARANEHKARLTDLLQKRVDELAREKQVGAA